MKIGVLALQGAFIEHQQILTSLDVEVVQVRIAEQLKDINGLIIPGGESTTIGKLADEFFMMEPLRNFAREHAVWGTCAGAIFLSKDIHRRQPLLGVMDITVERNAFGRQVDSFEIDLDIPCLNHNNTGKPFRAVFIRAPLIESIGEQVQLLAMLPEGVTPSPHRIVAAQQKKLLATSFHPELTGDDRFHRYFLELAQ